MKKASLYRSNRSKVVKVAEQHTRALYLAEPYKSTIRGVLKGSQVCFLIQKVLIYIKSGV